MPVDAASCATRPHSHGASSRWPATRSFSIDARISAGSASSARSCRATKSSGSSTPFAARRRSSRASTLRTSPQLRIGADRRRAAGGRGTSAPTARSGTRTSPIARGGCPARARRRRPRQRTRRRTPARVAASRRVERADAQPRHRADVRDDARRADRRRDVGDAAEHVVRADGARQDVDGCRCRSGTESRRRPARRAARSASRRCSTSHSLTQNITTSTGASDAGSSVASTRGKHDVAGRRSRRAVRGRASRQDARRARRTRRRGPPARACAPK